jgi:hypothetical protein
MLVTRTAAVVVLSASLGSGVGVAADAAPEVELRGRVVCLDAAGTVRPCEPPGSFALKTPAGELRAFLASDPLAALFADPEVRERELIVRAREAAESIEIIKVYSVRDGRTHDLDYFCEVCNVVAYAPGPCACCRRPLVLRERPLP